MSGGLTVLRSESRSESINISQRTSIRLSGQLTWHSKVGGLAKEILREVRRSAPPGNAGDLLRLIDGQCGHSEHLPSPLAVRRGNQWRLQVDEAFILEKLVRSEGERWPNPCHYKKKYWSHGTLIVTNMLLTITINNTIAKITWIDKFSFKREQQFDNITNCNRKNCETTYYK